MELTQEQMQEAQLLAQVMKMVGQKNDPSGTNFILSGVDQGGAFSYPHADMEVISAIIQPNSFIEKLPLYRSNIRDSVTQILTGQYDETGENPEDTCGDPIRPGALKTCNVLTRFGQMYVGSPKIKLDEVAMQNSYGTPPKTIINGAQMFAGSWVVPDDLRSPVVNTGNAAAMALLQLATAIKRVVARVSVTGNNSIDYTTTRGGWIKEFDGLDRLIAPITDIASGEACGAASPFDIRTWDAAIGDTVGGFTLMEAMIQQWRASRMIAEETGIDAAFGDPRMTWVMDKNLFFALVDFWTCNYQTYACVTSAGDPVVRDARELERRNIEMRNGNYLLIDGIRTPVEFTSGADVDQTTDPWNASIYLVPMNPRLTYLEYNPFDSAAVQEAIARFGAPGVQMVSNNGLYMKFKNFRNACAEINVTAQVRLMMKARFLSARIDGVEFAPQIGYRNWNPDGSSWYDGGSSVYQNYFPPAE